MLLKYFGESLKGGEIAREKHLKVTFRIHDSIKLSKDKVKRCFSFFYEKKYKLFQEKFVLHDKRCTSRRKGKKCWNVDRYRENSTMTSGNIFFISIACHIDIESNNNMLNSNKLNGIVVNCIKYLVIYLHIVVTFQFS